MKKITQKSVILKDLFSYQDKKKEKMRRKT